MAADQGAPGGFVRRVDLQQPRRRRRGRGRPGRCGENHLRDGTNALPQAPALLVQPGIEGRIEAGQVAQQVAPPQRQGSRLRRRGEQDLVRIDPQAGVAQREVQALGLQQVARRAKRLAQVEHRLAQ